MAQVAPPSPYQDPATWSEAQFQALVLDRARKLGWRTMHVVRSRVGGKGRGAQWVTNTSSKGYPDLTLVRGGRLIFVELKTESGTASPEQIDWMRDLQAVNARAPEAVEAYVVRPSQVQALFRRLE